MNSYLLMKKTTTSGQVKQQTIGHRLVCSEQWLSRTLLKCTLLFTDRWEYIFPRMNCPWLKLDSMSEMLLLLCFNSLHVYQLSIQKYSKIQNHMNFGGLWLGVKWTVLEIVNVCHVDSHTHITQAGSDSGLSCSYLLCECPCAAFSESNEPLIDSCCL